MKRSDLIFASVLVPLDFAMLIAAGLAAYFLRFQTLSDIRPVIYELPFSWYGGATVGVAVLTLIFFALAGLYQIGHNRIHNEIQKIASACSTSIMSVIVFIFFINELFSSRFIVLAGWILSIVCVILGRSVLHGIRYVLFRNGIGLHPIAIIGDTKSCEELVQAIATTPSLGYKVACHFRDFDATAREKIRTLADQCGIDELFVLKEGITSEQLNALFDFAQVNHIPIRYSADIIGGKKLALGMVGGIPLVEVRRTRLDGWGKILKRAFDIAGALILLVICLPLYAVIAIMIKLDSPGPVIYRNIRVGPRGKFVTYKFRSMYTEHCTGPDYDAAGRAEAYQEKLVKERSTREGPVFKVLNDPRRTRVGRFLERTSLDELPQFINVLIGNMSLVGPRPHMPQEVAGYGTHHHQLFSVKPGVTGLAQISGRSDLNFESEAKLDIFYIEQWSFWFDLVILFKTPLAVILRKSRV